MCGAGVVPDGGGCVASDVRCQPGSSNQGPDRMVGNPEQDFIYALTGQDIVEARVGGDAVFRGTGEDLVRGLSGDDDVWAGR